jgi:hypothetical protein
MKKLFLFGLALVISGVVIQTNESNGTDPKVMGFGAWNIIYLIGDLILIFSGTVLYHKNSK